MDNKGAAFEKEEFEKYSEIPGDVIKESPDLEKETILMEDVYEMMGGMGLYQWCTFVFVGMTSMFSAESININFVGGSQDHWCKVDQLQNFSYNHQKYVAVPYDSDGEYEQCKMFNLNYSSYSDEVLATWNRSLMVNENTSIQDCVQGWVYDQSQYVSTITSRLDLVCGDNWLISMLSTVFIGGVLVGAVGSGLLSDRFGRKPVFYWSQVLHLVVMVMNAFPINYAWLAITRFLMGVGNAGKFLTGFIIMMELVSSSWRSVLGVSFQNLFSVGFMMWPLLAYFLRDDIRLQLAGALPMTIFLLYWWPLDETPRWLLTKERYENADAVIRKIATINRATLPADFDIRNIQREEEQKSSKTCLDLLRSPKMRIRTLIADLHWFTDSLMYYALSLNTESLSGDVYVNTAISGAVEIPANIIVIFFLNWRITGRRFTSSVSLLIAGAASMLSIYMILTDQGMVHTIFSMVAKAFVTMGFSSIYVFTSELFPTEVRNIGLGTASMCARISGMLAPFVGGPLANVWAPLPSLVCGVFALLSGLLTLFLPETLGHQLFNTIEEAEAFGKSRDAEPVITKEVNGVMEGLSKDTEHTYL